VNAGSLEKVCARMASCSRLAIGLAALIVIGAPHHRPKSSAATRRAFGLINHTLDQQAQLWSYVDDFLYLGLLCVACVPLAFILKRTKHKQAAAG